MAHGAGQEPELQELRDFHDLQRRYNIVGIILGLLVLLLACPVLQYLAVRFSPMFGTGPGQALVARYVAPVVVAITFLVAIVPLLAGRLRILRRYRWTRERKSELERLLRENPDLFEAELATEAPASAAVKGPPAILLIVIIGLVAFVAFGGKLDLGPLSAVTSQFGIGQAATVSGEYRRHYDYKDLGGVAQADQTWSYVFRDDGGYTTYLNGNEQYSGTWSQSGNRLTIRIDPIPSLGTPGHTAVGTVAADGRSFTVGNEQYTKIE
jgi:hypothetical protein